jgi:hypothetical protein
MDQKCQGGQVILEPEKAIGFGDWVVSGDCWDKENDFPEVSSCSCSWVVVGMVWEDTCVNFSFCTWWEKYMQETWKRFLWQVKIYRQPLEYWMEQLWQCVLHVRLLFHLPKYDTRIS